MNRTSRKAAAWGRQGHIEVKGQPGKKGKTCGCRLRRQGLLLALPPRTNRGKHGVARAGFNKPQHPMPSVDSAEVGLGRAGFIVPLAAGAVAPQQPCQRRSWQEGDIAAGAEPNTCTKDDAVWLPRRRGQARGHGCWLLTSCPICHPALQAVLLQKEFPESCYNTDGATTAAPATV